MLTTLQPEDNCNVANTRANRGCQGTRCCCWKENVLTQHLGLGNAIQKEWGQAELCRGEQFHYLNAVQITKHIFVTVFFSLTSTKPYRTLYSVFRPVSDHTQEDIYPLEELQWHILYLCLWRKLRVIYDHVFGINCCGWRDKGKPLLSAYLYL